MCTKYKTNYSRINRVHAMYKENPTYHNFSFKKNNIEIIYVKSDFSTLKVQS